MAYIRLTLASRCLNGATDVSVFFPDDPKAPMGSGMAPRKPGVIPGDAVDKSRRYQVLWLLHGAFGSSGDWMRYSQIELFAEENGLIAACPSGENGAYVNAVRGAAWEDIVTIKLWGLVHTMLPSSVDPKDNFIAGLSMGGYGALRLGLRHPERYSRIGSFSGGVDIAGRYAAGTFSAPGSEDVFGPRESVPGSDLDLFTVLQQRAAQGGGLPPIYLSCGTKDALMEDNRRLRAALEKAGYDVTWQEEDYGHEWRFWNRQVEAFIRTLSLG